MGQNTYIHFLALLKGPSGSNTPAAGTECPDLGSESHYLTKGTRTPWRSGLFQGWTSCSAGRYLKKVLKTTMSKEYRSQPGRAPMNRAGRI